MYFSSVLPGSVTTLYAEFFQQVRSAEAIRSIADLKGSFVSKKIGQKNYWYLQHSVAGRQEQAYLGPETEALLSLIREHREGRLEKASDADQRRRLCAMLGHGGAALPDLTSGRILLLLAESGIFRLGTVLIGTHAFMAYSPLLGISWNLKARTQDIDIAQEEGISIALEKESSRLDLPEVLDRAKMGFFPIPQFSHKNPSTAFKMRGKEFRIDILTPMIGKESEKPVFLPSLNMAAQPLRFMDYLITDPIDCAIPYDAGILALVPNPARFALHKLIVSDRRDVSRQAKAKKDLTQAAALLEFLWEERRGDLLNAWDDLKHRGKKWRAPVFNSLRKIIKVTAEPFSGIEKYFQDKPAK